MRFAVLVSGTGTNLQALIDAERRGELAPAELAVVVSNRPDAGALARAERAGIPAVAIDHRGYADRDAFEKELLAELSRREAEAVVLAGFMRVLTARFIDRFPRRILNTHPALLPAFPGVDAPAQAIAHGVKISGCTVHFVDHGVDTGPIVLQAAVPVKEGDDASSLHARIQVEEHRLLPRAVRLLAAGALVCEDRRVRVAEAG